MAAAGKYGNYLGEVNLTFEAHKGLDISVFPSSSNEVLTSGNVSKGIIFAVLCTTLCI
jgi:2',3'-cyclic-nucleotide 2'-phosphodiesterase (5'-nucleotidase family)